MVPLYNVLDNKERKRFVTDSILYDVICVNFVLICTIILFGEIKHFIKQIYSICPLSF